VTTTPYNTRFDYLIVGAGAAGCVLAGRLSADPAIRVLLLEAGPDHLPGREHPDIRNPYPVSLGNPDFCWAQLTAEVGADRGNGEPRFSRHYLQGFGVGGGSNLQGMVALRGIPRDYDEWREAGAAGWGWDEVLPYFRRLEWDLDFQSALHGQEGPIPIRRIPPEAWAPFAKAFADSLLARGYPLIEDFNADFRSGVGSLPMANLPHQRVSAAMGYLDESVRRRPNLVIMANTRVERVDLQDRAATGVTALGPQGRLSLSANEVIVTAGAVHSPAILLRSGIGAGQHLQDRGIEVLCDLPGVGQHLMNHVGAVFATYLPRNAVQSIEQQGFGQSAMQFCSGIEGEEYDTLLVAVNRTAWHPLGQRIGALGVEVHRTHSLGEVRLRSADPLVPPEVKFNLLADERDLARLLVGLRLCMEVALDSRMAPFSSEWFRPIAHWVGSLSRRTTGNWLRSFAAAAPLQIPVLRKKLLAGSKLDLQNLLRNSAALREWALAHAGPPHHVSCTCRMGRATDPGAVVDSECRVFGVRNLRVIDASVMPNLVRANTHIPVLMIAEKMAERIRRSRTQP